MAYAWQLWPLLYPRQTSLINHSLPSQRAWILRASGSHYQLPGVGKGVETYFLSLILFIESPSFLTRVGKQAAYKMTKILRHAMFLPTQYCFRMSFEYLSLRQVVYHSLDFSVLSYIWPTLHTCVVAQSQQGFNRFVLCPLLICPKGSQNLYSQRGICD